MRGITTRSADGLRASGGGEREHERGRAGVNKDDVDENVESRRDKGGWGGDMFCEVVDALVFYD
jgi:hypothetical protein